MLTSLYIHGFRGFAEPELMQFAVPDGGSGSGLTILVGPNNSGKSSIIESLSLRRPYQSPSIHVGMRNRQTDLVRIGYGFDSHFEVVESVGAGRSETRHLKPQIDARLMIVPSRRYFEPQFARGAIEARNEFVTNNSNQIRLRNPTLPSFTNRLFTLEEKQDDFNCLLRRVIPGLLNWSIDQNENEQYYLKFTSQDRSHSSAGVGDGIISIFVILSALFDSQPGETIVIDEPELSLHPQVQRRLMSVIEEFSKDRQIVLATHSPFFITGAVLANGAKVARVWDRDGKTQVFSVDIHSDFGLATLLSNDIYKPHLFGLDAREIFFVDEKVTVLEGQEDVVLWPVAVGDFADESALFGWGAGGATNMQAVLKLLTGLGFRKVMCVLGNDMLALAEELQISFPDFLIDFIPAPDIRDKKPRPAFAGKQGLIDGNTSAVRPELEDSIGQLIERGRAYFSPNTA